jgi:methylmalonyl-CoA mutase C-terminal domain/subunit
VVSVLRHRRAVVAKLGFDAHWRGVIVVASALRDAGMEVVYLGHATAEQIVQVALQEDADLVGLSCLSGNHMEECPPVVRGLRDAGCDDVVVVVGGTIAPDDCRGLAEIGVHGVFPTGSALPEIVERISGLLDTVRPQTSRAASW